MLGLLTDPIVETTPDDSEAAVLGVPGEGGPTLLDNVELTPVGCREEGRVAENNPSETVRKGVGATLRP